MSEIVMFAFEFCPYEELMVSDQYREIKVKDTRLWKLNSPDFSELVWDYPVLHPVRSNVILILAVPPHISPGALSAYIQNFSSCKFTMVFICAAYRSAVLEFDSQNSADAFFVRSQGELFDDEHPRMHCISLFLAELTPNIGIVPRLTLSGEWDRDIMLPMCPICFQYFDPLVSTLSSSIITNDIGEEACREWGSDVCPICSAARSRCSICEETENLWVCFECGHVGCGRHQNGHALLHYRETNHRLAISHSDGWIWDYKADCSRSRAFQFRQISFSTDPLNSYKNRLLGEMSIQLSVSEEAAKEWEESVSGYRMQLEQELQQLSDERNCLLEDYTRCMQTEERITLLQEQIRKIREGPEFCESKLLDKEEKDLKKQKSELENEQEGLLKILSATPDSSERVVMTSDSATCNDQYFLSWYDFSCQYCGRNLSSGICIEACEEGQCYSITSGCTDGSSDTGFCYDSESISDDDLRFQFSFNNNHDQEQSSGYISIDLSDYKDEILSCVASKNSSGFAYDMKSCELVANLWAMFYYRDISVLSNAIGFSEGNQSSYGYSWWPTNVPSSWISASYSALEQENYITNSFDYGSNISLYLARYNFNGTFVGFKEVMFDLTRCGERDGIDQVWKQWGTNYYAECTFNLGAFVEYSDDELYDLYLLEDGVLRPIPVLVWNYPANAKSDTSAWRLGRRFFLRVKNEIAEKVQYASNISLELKVNPDDESKIQLAILHIKYAETEEENADFDPQNLAETEDFTSPSFLFSVSYTKDMSSFWRTAIIVLIVFLILGFVYWLFRSIIYTKSHRDDSTVGLFIAACLFYTFGTVLTLIVFIMTFFVVFVFFKWQKSAYLVLPPESEFWSISVFVWLGFGFMVIATIVELVIHSRHTVFFIDWDTPFDKAVRVPAWRRLMVANSWNRLLTTRTYSIEFTLMFMLLLLEGCDLQLLASPVPRTELIDVGQTYKILRFAFSVFLWIGLMIFQYFANMLIWFLFGNPFINFMDLCSVANNSVLIMTSETTGWYIHGRSVHAHSDEAMLTLNQHLAAEANDIVGLRGLMENTDDQVFRIYCAPDFIHTVLQTFDGIEARYSRKALVNDGLSNSKGRIRVEVMGAYKALNRKLQQFLQHEEGQPQFMVKESTFIENIIGLLPDVNDYTIFTIQQPTLYKSSTVIDFEWTLSIMYMLLFVGVEMETKSPAIGAFCVYFLDLLIMWIFRWIKKVIISERAIIDRHFLLE